MSDSGHQEIPGDPEARITALLLGELGAEEAQIVRAWIEQDPARVRLHDRLRQTIDLLRGTLRPEAEMAIPSVTPPESAPVRLSEERRGALLEKFKVVPTKAPMVAKPRRKYLAPLLRMAALLLLLALLAGLFVPKLARSRASAQRIALINNLRQLEGAKQQWALENKKSPTDVPTEQELADYLGRGGQRLTPIAGETYRAGRVDEPASAEFDASKGKKLLDSLRLSLLNSTHGGNIRIDAEGRIAVANSPTDYERGGSLPRLSIAERSAGAPVRSASSRERVSRFPVSSTRTGYPVDQGQKAGTVPRGGSAISSADSAGGALAGGGTGGGGLGGGGGGGFGGNATAQSGPNPFASADRAQIFLPTTEPEQGATTWNMAARRQPIAVSQMVMRDESTRNGVALGLPEQLVRQGATERYGAFRPQAALTGESQPTGVRLKGAADSRIGGRPPSPMPSAPAGAMAGSIFVPPPADGVIELPKLQAAETLPDRSTLTDLNAVAVTSNFKDRFALEDKVPILGDRPALGRLYRKEVESLGSDSRLGEQAAANKPPQSSDLSFPSPVPPPLSGVPNPTGGQSLVEEGRALYENGQIAQADGKLTQALRANPKDAAAGYYFKLANEAESAANRGLGLEQRPPEHNVPLNLDVSKGFSSSASYGAVAFSSDGGTVAGQEPAVGAAAERQAEPAAPVAGKRAEGADLDAKSESESSQRRVEVLKQELATQVGTAPLAGEEIVQTRDIPPEKEIRAGVTTAPEERVAERPAQPPPEPQPEVRTADNAFSTFSLNVSDVSYKLAAASLEQGQMPDPAGIRSEEFINAFQYHDPEPAAGERVGVAWERSRYPFAHNRDLLRFSVKTAARGREAARPLNLVLCLDNSGSMERADRVQILREALAVLAQQLQPADRISVVAFARTARLWVDALPGNQASTLVERVGDLNPEGGTNLEDALRLAYDTAARHHLAGGVNRVVLLTDGAANLGNVDPESLRELVIGQRQRGIALDCFGVGWEGYNDDLLENLSRNADGRYGFLNSVEEASTEFAGQLAGALQVAASDVKVQVEFNPRRVTSYRQIGYAKHQLTKEQFRDNTVDAAEIGAAESGNALYVIQTDPSGIGPLATVRVRLKVPETGQYEEREWVVPYSGPAPALEESGPSLRLAATASALSEWLATSPFAGDVTTDRLQAILRGVPELFALDPRPKQLESMIRQAGSLSGK